MRKLLLFGPKSVHITNYLELIEGYFDEILIISNDINPDISYPQVKVSFSISSPLSALVAIKRVRREVMDFIPDIIHVHNIGTGAFILEKAVRGLKIPKIATAWGSDILLRPSNNFIFRIGVRKVLTNFDAFVSDSLYVAYKMQELTKKKLSISIANFGVDAVEVQSELKEKIIYSNRLHESLYRIEDIIDLFGYFVKENHDWMLVIAGSGSKTDDLKRRVAEMHLESKILFVGWVDKKTNAEWYKRAMVYVSIPKSDGTSISLLEAMEHGCLPVVSNVPANLEWITDAYNGVIYKNELAIFDQVIRLNFSKVQYINKEIIALHGLKSCNSKKYLDLYSQCLNK